LTDDEIASFSKLSSAEIIQYAKQQSALSLRWRLLNAAYFDRSSSFQSCF
jgi:hypothetical protein